MHGEMFKMHFNSYTPVQKFQSGPDQAQTSLNRGQIGNPDWGQITDETHAQTGARLGFQIRKPDWCPISLIIIRFMKFIKKEHFINVTIFIQNKNKDIC